MKRLPLSTALLALLLCNGLFAADNPDAKPAPAQADPRQATPEEIKARLAEHTREKAVTEAQTAAATPAEASAVKAEEDAVTMLPQIHVSSSRITELDIQIKKLDKQIAKAKKHVKPTELDESLNGEKTPKALAIFGGKTAAQRQSVAADRVTFLEAQRDILEAMKHVRTQKDLDQLTEQLNAMKTMSRELDSTLH
jgi:hypothetical protein